MARPLLAFVVGTRPDAIKTAPVVAEMRRFADLVETIVVSTGQHREMLDQALRTFGLEPEVDLGIMRHGQGLADLTARALTGLDEVFAERRPDVVFAQGDTTTTFCGALAAFYRQIPFAHVEAGLRTPSIWSPFPEEFNRRAIGMFARLNFSPTVGAAENLYAEGAPADTVFVTGNTGIDGVLMVAEREGKGWLVDDPARVVTLTTHRRENWGAPQEAVFRAANRLLAAHPDIMLIVPMHRNPDVRARMESAFAGNARVRLIEPPDYEDFVHLLKRSFIVLTDSGGVQEEAPSLGVPVLVLRETTERPEGIDAGTALLVGTDENTVFEKSNMLLSDIGAHRAMAQVRNPYGDGRASERIRYETLRFLGLNSPEVGAWI